MVGKAASTFGRRSCTRFATVSLLLVLGASVQMPSAPSAGEGKTTSRCVVEKKKATNINRACAAVMYAEAYRNDLSEQSRNSVENSESSPKGEERHHYRRPTGSKKKTPEPFHKKHRRVILVVAAILAIVLAGAGFKYFTD